MTDLNSVSIKICHIMSRRGASAGLAPMPSAKKWRNATPNLKRLRGSLKMTPRMV